MFGSVEASKNKRKLASGRLALLVVSLFLGLGSQLSCSPLPGATSPQAAPLSPLAKKWFERARLSLESLDAQDAEVAIASALRLAPEREEVRLLAARIALSQLRFDEALQAVKGLSSRQAQEIEARALWNSGQLERATRSVDRLLDVQRDADSWAEKMAMLTRVGSGREPFRVTGSSLAVVEMLQVPQPTLIVPVELNGEEVLAMIATGSSEVVVDGAKAAPSWVSLRFGRRLEVKDVPALSRDLSEVSKRVGVPIRLLLGRKLLSRLNATFDFHGSQFIARNFTPTPPSGVSRLPVSYLLDGRMVFRTQLSGEKNAAWAGLLLDTEQMVTLSLTESGWSKAGQDPKGLLEVTGESSLKQGKVGRLTLGSFDIPGVPGVYGLPVPSGDGAIVVDGLVGSSLIAEFRVTFADEGRALWLEPLPKAL